MTRLAASCFNPSVPTVSVNLDSTTHARLRQFLKSQGVSASDVLREAIRHTLDGTVRPFEAGWRSGRAAAMAVTLKRIREAIAGLDAADRPTIRRALSDALRKLDE